MKIQLKLTLGVGLLFVLIIFQSAVGIVYINTLKSDTKNILVANYNTLQYARNMMLALDKIQEQENALDEFERNLKKQTSNLTEIGEREATYELQKHFFRFKSLPSGEAITLLPQIRTDISVIMELNMKAIERKSTIANKTASSATIWIIFTGTACFLIAFTLLVNLPKNIANPIKELTRSKLPRTRAF
jgi:two-component system, NtrC family, sensor histidine kinase KinB